MGAVVEFLAYPYVHMEAALLSCPVLHAGLECSDNLVELEVAGHRWGGDLAAGVFIFDGPAAVFLFVLIGSSEEIFDRDLGYGSKGSGILFVARIFDLVWCEFKFDSEGAVQGGSPLVSIWFCRRLSSAFGGWRGSSRLQER